MRHLPLLSLGLAVGLFALGGSALARSACERYRAELSSLDRSASAASNLGAAAHRQRQEVQRLSGYYRSIGCDGGQFSFFGAPPECAALAQRIHAMESTSVQLATSSDAEGINARRRQLRTAIARECQPEEPRQESAEASDQKGPSYRATGGPRLVCVRACDGYFFPLQNVPAKDSASAMCRALCPNAETVVFHAPAEGSIEKAVSDAGKPYFKLANAFRYQKAFDASCSCKKDGDSWASVLQRAERMLAQRKGDIVVTAKLSQELSRPRVVLSHLGRAKKARAATEEAKNVAPTGSGPDQTPRAGMAQKASFDPDATGTVKPEHAGPSGAEAAKHADDIGTSANPRVIPTSR